MTEINYDMIIQQLQSELATDCSIANRYGLVLSSAINEFAKGKIIPQAILDVISRKDELEEELKLTQINSFALEAENYYYLFSFSEELILISKLELSVNLAKFMPSISTFLTRLSKSSKAADVREFSFFDFGKEIRIIEDLLKKDEIKKEKYQIIKELIKYVSL